MTVSRNAARGAGLLVVAVAVSLAGAAPSRAVGGSAVTDGRYGFVAEISIGTGDGARACSGALVAPQWVVTARDCFAAGAQPVTLGVPATAATVTVGRLDLTTTAGHVSPVSYLVPHPDRDVVLAKLVTPATGVTPVPVAAAPAAAGEVLRMAGFGRTATEWRPDRLHAADFTVGTVSPAGLSVEPATADATVCKGDAGGPALRDGAGGLELVGVHDESWQGGCLGNSAETRRGATETRVDDLAGWIRQTSSDVAVYGALPDGRLTYSVIDSATGDRLTTVTSGASLGFAPKAMAALNATTLLVTSPAGRLHRVDVTGNNPVLTFAAPVDIAGGWVHDRLAYDGDGSLYGIAGDTLRRYTVTTAKPARGGHIINNTAIGTGFTLRTLTATGPDWILGTTAAGTLRSYRITPEGGWQSATLATDSSWAGLTSLVSPGGGLYYGRTATGGMQRFADTAPFDLSGADLRSFPADPVDTAGWDATVLAAVPFSAYPQGPADVSVFGATSDGRLTYSAIDSATGDRLTTVTSGSTLGFVPKAMATLNFDTVLVTSPAGRLHRVDVLATSPSLVFAPPVDLGGGWVHKLLAYDGRGSLFGIAGSSLRRYTVTAAKPSAANITANTLIDDGFVLDTLTAAAPGWILGTTSAGQLLSYQIRGAGDWSRYALATSGWTMTHLTSPGNGVYYARNAAGGLLRFADAAPTNGSGTDITAFPGDPVDAGGWTQILLSAQPYIA